MFIGGKGKSLVKSTNSGLFNVPLGFCVTKRVYEEILRDFLDKQNLDELVVNVENIIESQSLLRYFRKFIREYDFSQQFISDVEAQIVKLGCINVAVRSSASCEDSADRSFAGQFKTFLGIKSSNVFDSIKKCIASAFGENVLLYASKSNVDYQKFYMAVVVQKFIQSDKAGVLFSKNPLDPLKEGFWVDANFGVGESVVSGRIKPDKYIIRQTHTEVEVSEDKKAYSYMDGKLSVSKKSGRVLNDKEIKKLFDMANKLIKLYDRDIEFEWCFFNDQLYLLQTRPITTI